MVSLQGDHNIDVMVRSLTLEAPTVLSVELVPVSGCSLPRFEAGAHIDLKLPNGCVRQYSLCGDPEDTTRYRLAIRLIPEGQSSNFIHRVLRPGDVVSIGRPRNNFPLLPSKHYIFVAGGIGITPLIPMMHSLSARSQTWTLIYCNRRHEDAPFLAELGRLGGVMSLHASEAGTRLDVRQRFSHVEPDTVVYCCGPEELMSEVERATTSWPAGAVRFERFRSLAPLTEASSQEFEVVCDVSGKTLTVLPDQSILAAVRAAGIDVPYSCEQGICGACESPVLRGDVEHRDSVLTEQERSSGKKMMICVSRSKSRRLILEI